MRSEVGAVYRSPKAPLKGASIARETRHAIEAGPICLLPRHLDPAIAVALDDLATFDLPTFDVSGARDRMCHAVDAALSEARHATLFAWLKDDVVALVDLYASITGSRTLRARLQAVDDDMCRAFHVDNVVLRLVTTYRGPGTQWLAPGHLDGAPASHPIAPRAVRQMSRGTVAFIRGSKNASPDRPGLLHRSPPIAGTGMTRLFLAINEAET